MELIVMSGGKIKVMLNQKDIERYDIRASDLSYEDIHTRQAFRAILAEVRAQTGFDTEGEQLLVQVYPSKDGGCELFITKLSHQSGTWGVGEGVTMLSFASRTYGISSLDDLLCVAKTLHAKGYQGPSSLYRSGKGEWYLKLQIKVRSGVDVSMEDLAFLHEYNTTEHGALMACYIEEHERVVIEKNAIEVLSRL